MNLFYRGSPVTTTAFNVLNTAQRSEIEQKFGRNEQKQFLNFRNALNNQGSLNRSFPSPFSHVVNPLVFHAIVPFSPKNEAVREIRSTIRPEQTRRGRIFQPTEVRRRIGARMRFASNNPDMSL